jgi:hypothetical protein
MRTTTMTAALALALALAACSSSDADDAAKTQATPAASAEGGSYSSTAAIIAAMGKAGLTCDTPMSGSYEGVSEAQSCIVNDSEDVVLLRFATPQEKAEYLENKDELASAVVGQDWAVQTVLPQTADRRRDLVGGEVRLGEGGEQTPG